MRLYETQEGCDKTKQNVAIGKENDWDLERRYSLS